jgi:hypothetical protein
MSDVSRYKQNRAKRDPEFAENYEEGFEKFRIGLILRQVWEAAGLTREVFELYFHLPCFYSVFIICLVFLVYFVVIKVELQNR